ncbi:protein kinase family protein [Oenococcus kitaharae]|uniref:Putative serine/threonine protein kinase n=1 Tax=Oenococcus kitaharae DSM 17330 TaxID=1045004 RepID=G9WGU0_9LACO|nr:protein kinase family protein [Oenococcus kitaharae]EHN59348.1 Putative serine/threonine protein kinase [Oenococcus kitaharae DSM 17330]OEY82142.1 hypothetical protein NT96_07000 [Oenococcus kitaharae]OEY82565.1 hypothetical protein NV75_07445 [Oenococcus kitaharae]OEY84820.1 hypothetical protein NT95_00040 [Oenococcus kitaharae]
MSNGDLDNFIAAELQKLDKDINLDFQDLYVDFKNSDLINLLSTLQSLISSDYVTDSFAMNQRLPTDDNEAYFWAPESRKILSHIRTIERLQDFLVGNEDEFQIDSYYKNIFDNSLKFLKPTGGSVIPPHTAEVTLYLKKPIFLKSEKFNIKRSNESNWINKQLIGQGSYARIYKYNDPFYKTTFILKSAQPDLNDQELRRFKQEFAILRKLDSPYIVKVYDYNETNNTYTMEYMKSDLDKFINHNNNKPDFNKSTRFSIVNQLFAAYKYVHDQGELQRDVNPKNILINQYGDQTIVVKLSDFNLAKIPNSEITESVSEVKGHLKYIDPALPDYDFKHYGIKNEIYSIALVINFVMTGKESFKTTKNEQFDHFMQKATDLNINNRYENVSEMKAAFKKIIFDE